MGTILWIAGLFIASFVWAFMTYTAMYGPASFQDAAGVALGMSAPIFGLTGMVAGVVYLITKSRTTALWTWTALIALAFATLGVGALRVMRG